jgi:hypothetical protein
VYIHELLSRSDPPLTDAIELHNPGPEPANVGGWFLSDEAAWPRKFVVPAGTVLPPGGFVTFTEEDFNPTPGTNLSFSLSGLGETLHLCSGDGTNLTGYSHGARFGAAAAGVSFGRHVNSAGGESFPAQLARTFNGSNSGPRFGPVVLSEVQYHPPTGGVEFIEIHNAGPDAVALFDPVFPTNTWRLGGAGYAFPPGLTLPAGGLVVVAATNEAVFRTLYAVPTNALVLGPLPGLLQDSGERLTLERPDMPETNGVVPYVVVDEVRYNDKAPWPAGADGAGESLQRRDSLAYGDEPLNWTAAAPTPGSLLPVTTDRDGDGMPDDWELANGFDPDNAADAALDADADGADNVEEFGAGTDPRSAASVLRLAITPGVDGTRLVFAGVSGRGYVVEARGSLGSGSWAPLVTVPVLATPRSVEVTDTNRLGQRFYRVVLAP